MLALLTGVHGLVALGTSRTLFQPDEFWQSLEVAHKIVFGYGYLTWEWASAQPIRSIAHPAMFVPLYYTLRMLGLDHVSFLMTTAPQLQQALLTAVGDWFAYRLVVKMFGRPTALVWIIVHLSSMFWLFTATRTFANTAETALTSIAMFYWPLSPSAVGQLTYAPHLRDFRKALFFAFLTVLLRPTSLVFWMGLGLLTLTYAGHRKQVLWHVIWEPLWIGALVLGFGVWLDSLYYGYWTCPAFSFFVQNVVTNVSAFYGANAWHWYLTVCLPTFLTCFLWAFGHGIRYVIFEPRYEKARPLLILCAWTILVYSLLQHKEIRFLQQLVPWLHVFASVGLQPPATITSLRNAWAVIPRWIRICLVAQLPVLVYVCAFHGRAQVAVTTYLHALTQSDTPPKSIGFLMPCHSTPWQSHLHSPSMEAGGPSGDAGLAWFLGCPPPPAGASDYWDQMDFFYHDPELYLLTRFPDEVDVSFPPMDYTSITPTGSQSPYDKGWRHSWPSHIVLFSSLLDVYTSSGTILDLLRSKGYREGARFWNAIFHPDEKRRGDVVVLVHYSMGITGS